jgi:enoyl-CoA hydratase/carnithine racemase
MSYEQILYEVQDGIAKITFNRPDKLNAWTPQMGEEIFSAMQSADQDPEVRVIVLTGSGRAFCAGADMEVLSWVINLDIEKLSEKEIQEQFFPLRKKEGVKPDYQWSFSYFPALDKPVIGMVNGHAVGFGLVMALYCDIRFVSDSAHLSTAFSRRGLVAENGLSWVLPRLIGLPKALDLLISGRTIDGKEAYEMGMANYIVSDDDLETETMKYAKDMADNCSPRSMRLIKKQVYEGLLGSLNEATELSNKETILSFGSADFKEGVAHFLENRPPRFPSE